MHEQLASVYRTRESLSGIERAVGRVRAMEKQAGFLDVRWPFRGLLQPPSPEGGPASGILRGLVLPMWLQSNMWQLQDPTEALRSSPYNVWNAVSQGSQPYYSHIQGIRNWLMSPPAF